MKAGPLPPLPLEEWDELIGRHLQLIEAGAEICENHAKQLFGVPEWETRAADQLDKAERLISSALLRLNKAKQEMKGKPHVS
jgi:hypothetical protein